MMAAQSGIRAVSSRTALAGSDPLTSLANRATLLAALRARLGQLRRPGDTVTLLMVDLDNFKRINDDNGHLVGDRVLVEVARRLEEATRSADLVARFGGDEFGILLADRVTQRNAAEVAERIRLAVARPIQLRERTVLVGVSIGIGVTGERAVQALDLIQRADDALYRVKRAANTGPGREQPTTGHRSPAAVLQPDREVCWDEPVYSITTAQPADGSTHRDHPPVAPARSSR
jgi:diguanylate cyclase (GGDEF)-like protein